MKSRKLLISLIVLLSFSAGIQAVNAQTSTPQAELQPLVIHPTRADVSPPLRVIPPASLSPEVQERERLTRPIPREYSATSQDKASPGGLQPQTLRATLNMRL